MLSLFSKFAQIFALSSHPMRGEFYLDPGSGSFILQILLAALLGAGFLVKTYWKKIIAFIRRQPANPDDETKDE